MRGLSKMRTIYPAAAAALLIGASAQAAPVKIAAQQSTITYSTTAGTTSGFGNYARATSTVVYDAATDTYTVRDTGSLTTTSSFGPSDVNSGASNSEFTVYSKNGGNETFRRLNQGAGNPVIQLTYVDYGEWKRSTTSGGTTSVNDTYLVFGSKTPGASVPRTGSATYNTIYDGTFVDTHGAHALGGNGSMTANWASASLSYTATITGVPSGSLAFAGSDSINFQRDSFTTSTSNSTSGYTLSQYGNFYGPAAQEVGGLFRLTGQSGNGQGAFVGK
jgi:hypothetical protein